MMKRISLTMGLVFFVAFSNLMNAQNNFLNFDGANDYITINSPTGYPSGNDARTFEAWVQVPVGATGTNNIVTYGPIVGQRASRFRITNTEIQWGIINTEIAFGVPSPIYDNNWHHIALVYPGGGLPITASTAYFDGVLVPSTGSTLPNGVPNTSTSTPVLISSSGANRLFEGNLDEVRVWTVARTQAEIQAAMNTPLSGAEANLVAYYDFNQGVCGGSNPSATVLNDLTSNNNDGTLSNFALTACTSNWVCGGTTCNIVDNGLGQAAGVPTLSQWGLIILGLLVLCFGSVRIFQTRFKQRTA